MSEKKNRFAVGVLATMAVVAGCSKVPQERVDAAVAQLAEAATAGADLYAGAELTEARQAKEALDAEIAAQADRFVLVRSYDRTAELAATAEQAALAARTAAEAGESRARADAAAALESLDATQAAASGLLAELGGCKRKPKGFAADLETLGGTLEGFASRRSEVEAASAGEDFLGAVQLAASVQGEIEALIAEMNEAKAKIGC